MSTVIFYMPPRYFKQKATDQEKEIFKYYSALVKELAEGKRSSIILPSERDPESRQRLFEVVFHGDGANASVSQTIQLRPNEEK